MTNIGYHSFFATSCEKKEDIEVKGLESAYVESVTIINISPYNWDNALSPDLILKLGTVGISKWEYITKQYNNVKKVPKKLSFTKEIHIIDERWELELIDQDDLNDGNVIYRLSFNPYNNAENGKIPIYNKDKENGGSLLVLILNYYIKK